MRQFACAAALLVFLPSAGAAQETTIAPPPSITVEGIPPIPQSIADGLARYAQFRQAYLQAWHPTRRQMVIGTALGAVPQLHLVAGPSRDRRQLTWYPRGVHITNAAASFDPADGNSFVFMYEAAGNELKSVYRYDLTTGEASLVSESKTRYGPVWARQGTWIAFDSAERNGKDRDLYVMQPSDPKTKRRLADFDGPYAPQDWSPDGHTLLANEVVSNQETYFWRVDVKTGAKTALTPRGGEKAAFFNGRFSADGKKVYALSDRSDGDWRIWQCELANWSWTAVTGEGIIVNGANDSPQGGFEISPDGTLLAVIVDRG